ncbi:MAG: oligoendopeptidase, partial [Ilumatobacteraceae bacterium]
MTALEDAASVDLAASDVAWDIDTIIPDGQTTDDLYARADALATGLEGLRGTVATLDAGGLAAAMTTIGEIEDLLARAYNHAMLAFTTATGDPARGAAVAKAEERSTEIRTKLIFFELEWAAADDAHVESVLADPRLSFCDHHLATQRLMRSHLLSEPVETVLAEQQQTGSGAWARLFDELSSGIEPVLPEAMGGKVPLMLALSHLGHGDREVRRTAADAVTDALQPGLRTRAYVFNTLLLDKSMSDRRRNFPSWISSRNLANEASDDSVQALIDAV